MPCLILTGLPSCGKSTLAAKIRGRALRLDAIQNVLILSEAQACPDKAATECYHNAQSEKETRAALKSAFDRAVNNQSDTTLVILDSLNYIKGFRYELYCSAKAAAQRYAVVWVQNDLETIKAWNQQRTNGYDPQLLEELVLRYEAPNERNRWDRPLYRIDMRPITDEETANRQEAPSVYNMHATSSANNGTAPENKQQKPKPKTTFRRATFKRATAKPAKETIEKKSVETKAPSTTIPPNTVVKIEWSLETEAPSTTTEPTTAVETKEPTTTALPSQKSLDERVDDLLSQFLNQASLQQGTSTLQHVASDANVLHNVDSITQHVCTALAAAPQTQSSSNSSTLVLTLQKENVSLSYAPHLSTLAAPQLQQLRRQYIQWIALHPPEDVSPRGIAQSFLNYIEVQN